MTSWDAVTPRQEQIYQNYAENQITEFNITQMGYSNYGWRYLYQMLMEQIIQQ